ncbi:LPXTG cell wall anchor domain-containing protein [Lactococcus cremoris]|uniref:LPXTG cell wall anchor domain-containing protein n=1 Tax=Lactococcus lactis subsp. cremoris TaxID=1359 RepID=UPI001E48C697
MINSTSNPNGSESIGNGNSSSSTAGGSGTTGTSLPKTGETSGSNLTGLGLGLFGALGALVGRRKSKDDKKA